MKRSLVFFLYSMLAAGACYAGNDERADAPSCNSRLSTALDHLSVIEYDEAVVQAATGSKAFQIEWQNNKVFVLPLRADASTNLFVWTASNKHFCYELTVGDVARMNAQTEVSVPKPAPPAAPGAAPELIEKQVIEAMIGAENLKQTRAKEPKNSIVVRVEQAVRSNKVLFLRYSVENRTSRPYAFALPGVYQVRPDQPSVDLSDLQGSQLTQATAKAIGPGTEIQLPVVHPADKAVDVAPGARKEGVIAVRQPEDFGSPTVLHLVFTGNYEATVVL
jgi:hypothetical protein